MTELEREVVRARWRRYLESAGLSDPRSSNFGQSGLGALFGDSPALRLLILPADSERFLIDFDQDFWEWWRTAKPDPGSGRTFSWGSSKRSFLDGATVGEIYDKNWTRYLAVLRNGGLEAGLGEDVTYGHGDVRGIRLVRTVGRLWSALASYASVSERYPTSGPWSISPALCRVQGMILGDFAAGWQSGQFFGVDQKQVATHALVSLEIEEWPVEPADVQALAMRLGGVIEDAWGSVARRFLDSHTGQFDSSKYVAG